MLGHSKRYNHRLPFFFRLLRSSSPESSPFTSLNLRSSRSALRSSASQSSPSVSSEPPESLSDSSNAVIEESAQNQLKKVGHVPSESSLLSDDSSSKTSLSASNSDSSSDSVSASSYTKRQHGTLQRSTDTHSITAAAQKVPATFSKELLWIFLYRLHDGGPRQVDRTLREWNIDRAAERIGKGNR